MSTEIYYFSGTGNSLHAAKELQKRLPGSELIPMVKLMNKDGVKAGGEAAGFVFPIHLATAPMLVQDFIRKLDLSGVKYVFAVATRAGTPSSAAFAKIGRMLEGKGKRLDSYLFLNMASNDSKFDNWHDYSDIELSAFEEELQTKLDELKESIVNNKMHQGDTHVSLPMNPMLEGIGAFMAGLRGYLSEDFYSDAKCTGCGTCEKVCLSRKIRMAAHKPEWQKKSPCYLCYACINYCPAQSIQIRSKKYMKIYTEKNGRYHHPEVTANDISVQK